MTRFDVVIVGAGHGGAETAAALRHMGFAGSIALVGDENELPYERPPLSKEYLKGDKPFERLLIRPAAFWTKAAVTLLPGRRVVAVEPDAHVVACATGERIGYRWLVWATGGEPRRLSCTGHDLAGVHAIRRRADVDALIAEWATASRAVVIGGGYIGLEAASVLVGAGRQVTVIEAEPRVLARVAGEPVSRFYEAEHRARGVDIRLGTAVLCLEEDGPRVCGVRLAGGEVLPADIVVVGVGIEPAVDPLRVAGALAGAQAGAQVLGGVAVDEQCRTSLSDVFAVGDCAAAASRFADGARVRIESVGNAHAQAAIVAAAITGRPAPAEAVPWFWSNQYDLKLQTVGLSRRHDSVVIRGDPGERSFSAIYLRAGRVIALDCVNRVRDYAQGRRLVAEEATLSPAQLADPAIPLKAWSTPDAIG